VYPHPLVHMLPVALSCVGAGLDRGTVLFVGWFGPAGLPRWYFALLALEELGPTAEEAVAVIGVTVFVSVLAHGLIVDPLASRCGRALLHPARRRTRSNAESEPTSQLDRRRRCTPDGTSGSHQRRFASSGRTRSLSRWQPKRHGARPAGCSRLFRGWLRFFPTTRVGFPKTWWRAWF
jgi:hypothetical protein